MGECIQYSADEAYCQMELDRQSDWERVNGVPYYRWVAVDGERRLMEGDRMIS